MKKSIIITPVVILISCLILSGCSIFTTKGRESKAVSAGKSKVENVDNKINANTNSKLDLISEYAYGVSYVLNKIDEPSREVTVALDINQRIVSLSGNPTLDKMKEMQKTIDNLTSELSTERTVGKQKLDDKDKDIVSIQQEGKELAIAKDIEIKKYMTIAEEAAAAADSYKVKLDDLTSGWGFNAIWFGIKKMVTRLSWVIGIGSILFIVLRISSAANPIAGAIFSIFEQMVSWVVKTIQFIFPKAVNMAGFVTQSVYDTTKSALAKTINAIELAKLKGNNVDDIKTEVAKSMDTEHKDIIKEIKSDLNY